MNNFIIIFQPNAIIEPRVTSRSRMVCWTSCFFVGFLFPNCYHPLQAVISP